MDVSYTKITVICKKILLFVRNLLFVRKFQLTTNQEIFDEIHKVITSLMSLLELLPVFHHLLTKSCDSVASPELT